MGKINFSRDSVKMKLFVLLAVALAITSVMGKRRVDWAEKAMAEAQKDMKLLKSGDFGLPKWATEGKWGTLGGDVDLSKLTKLPTKGEFGFSGTVIRSSKRVNMNGDKKSSEGKTQIKQFKKSSKKGKTSCQQRSKSTKTKNGKEVNVQGSNDWKKCSKNAVPAKKDSKPTPAKKESKTAPSKKESKTAAAKKESKTAPAKKDSKSESRV